jgi:hypothetical protein
MVGRSHRACRLCSRGRRIALSGLLISIATGYPGRRGLGRERPEPALLWAVLDEAFSLREDRSSTGSVRRWESSSGAGTKFLYPGGVTEISRWLSASDTTGSSSAEKAHRSRWDRSRGADGRRFTADEQGRGVEARWARKAFCADSVSQLVLASLRDAKRVFGGL